jgi:anti-anti-sigma factor
VRASRDVREESTVTNPEPPSTDVRPNLEFTVTHPAESACVIVVTCELDVITTPALDRLITHELDSGHSVLVLDLAGCDFMGSSGLAVLMSTREHTSATPTRFALAGLNRTVTRALQAVGLEDLFDIHPDTPSALSALGAA